MNRILIILACGVTVVAYAANWPTPLIGYFLSMTGLILIMAVKKNPIGTFSWIWWPWVLALAPSMTGLLTYTHPAISLDALLYIFFYVSAASVGYLVTFHSSPHPIKTSDSHCMEVVDSILYYRNIISYMAILGILGAVFFAIEMILIVRANVGDLFILRDQFSSREVGALSRLAPLLVWCSWVALAAAIIGWEMISPIRRVLWLTSAFSATFLSILSAGRQTVFQILIIVALCFLYRLPLRKIYKNANPFGFYRRVKKLGLFARFFATVSVVGGVFYMGLVAVFRQDQTNSLSKSEYLFYVFRVEPQQEVYKILSSIPYDIGDAIYEAIIYFSSGISLFSGFLTIQYEGFYGGTFTFPWLARRFEILTDTSVVEAMQRLQVMMESGRFMSHGWATAFASYVLDFGHIGAFLFMFLVGILSAMTWRMYAKRPDIFSLMLIFAANINLFYMIMVPATSDSIFFFFVIGNVLLHLLLPLRRTSAVQMQEQKS